MKYQTRISKMDRSDESQPMHVIRGKRLSNLLAEKSFSETVFFLLSGREPDPKEAVLFDKMLLSVIDHGMGTTSSMTSRFVASGGNSLHVAVAGGVLSIGDYHGGAVEKAMKQFLHWVTMDETDLREEIKRKILAKEIIYGFGHKVYKTGDPRVEVLTNESAKLGFISKYLHLKDIIEDVFSQVKGRAIHANVDAILALFLCDFGFDPLLGKGIFLIGRVPGLIAQSHEELVHERPVRRVPEERIELVE
ncbi:citryl-CoA lyase [archaeon]|nr:citryl-CoA lyase [archaeon]|tara:strand:- start:804 stop:1550 length:747 start_codon:yes stop_codon:yes gene_type:complete